MLNIKWTREDPKWISETMAFWRADLGKDYTIRARKYPDGLWHWELRYRGNVVRSRFNIRTEGAAKSQAVRALARAAYQRGDY